MSALRWATKCSAYRKKDPQYFDLVVTDPFAPTLPTRREAYSRRIIAFGLSSASSCLSDIVQIICNCRRSYALIQAIDTFHLVDQAPGMVFVVSFGLLCLLGAVLAWIDTRYGIIPDWLNLTIASLGLSKAVIIDGPMAGLEAFLRARPLDPSSGC